jgi:hypothetical protein
MRATSSRAAVRKAWAVASAATEIATIHEAPSAKDNRPAKRASLASRANHAQHSRRVNRVLRANPAHRRLPRVMSRWPPSRRDRVPSARVTPAHKLPNARAAVAVTGVVAAIAANHAPIARNRIGRRRRSPSMR